MGTAHLFSYNLFSNGVITGCTQYGDMAVSLNTTDTPGFTVSNMGNPYHGPDEDFGYVIAKASSAGTRTHKRGTELAPDAVSFIRSTSKTDASFVDLVNKNFNQSFSLDSSGASTAKSYLTTNEYWTSYSTDTTFTLVMNLDSTTGVTGSTWTDISGGGHNATLNGGYGTTTYNGNQVVTLNGSSGYVLPSSFGTELSTGFTNNVWVYPTTTSNGTIISEWGGTPPNGWTDAQIALFSGTIRGGVFNPGNFSPTGYITGPTFSANTWYNIAMTYNSTTKDLMLYINGTLNSTINGVKSNPGTLYLTLGRADGVSSYLGGASGYFQGYVGSWKIWNGPISATNILSNYNSTKSIYGLLGSLVFNGTNQSLSISPGITFGSGAFTVEGWFYNTSNFNNKGVMGSPVTSPVGCLNLHFSSNTTLISDKNGGGGSKTYTMSSAITTGAWHYLIYNRNSDGTTAVYIDGTRAGSTQSDTLNYNTSTDTIGRDYAGYWPGYWTNMRVTVGTAVYDSNSTTQTNPLQQLTSLANTKYLMLGSSVTTDTSGTQTITNNNTVTQSSTLKPF